MPIKDPQKRKEAQRRADAKRAQRSRGWACIVYPESAPENWQAVLAESHVQALISPLHDSDVTADGTPKKPHYHVMLMFENPMPAKSAKEIFSKIGYEKQPECLKSIKAYARYLVHIDDHDKHRYNETDVTQLCGASWASVALDPADEKDMLLNEIEDFIDEHGIVSYRELCRYARHERPEWTKVIRSSTVHLMAYIKSAAWEASQREVM